VVIKESWVFFKKSNQAPQVSLVRIISDKIREKRKSMSLEEIEMELELAGVSRDKIMKLLSYVKSNGYDAKELDRKLRTMGIEPVFSIYDEE
jgi:flagellar basal body P-ring protein FlgI